MGKWWPYTAAAAAAAAAALKEEALHIRTEGSHLLQVFLQLSVRPLCLLRRGVLHRQVPPEEVAVLLTASFNLLQGKVLRPGREEEDGGEQVKDDRVALPLVEEEAGEGLMALDGVAGGGAEGRKAVQLEEDAGLLLVL